MASNEAIKKMIHAIMNKRKELGILDWGVVPPEEVIDRINNQSKDNSSNPNNLASDSNTSQNNRRGTVPPSPAAKPQSTPGPKPGKPS